MFTLFWANDGWSGFWLLEPHELLEKWINGQMMHTFWKGS